MAPNKAWFETFKDQDGGEVFLGNNKSCKIKGIVTIRIRLHNALEKVMTNVRCIPELKRNLISLGVLDDLGYTVKLEASFIKIMKGSLLVMKEAKKIGIYSLLGSTVIGTSSSLAVDQKMNNTVLWHRRLGHVS